MSAKTTLSVLAALSVLGVGSGTWLGHASIAEIDPFYFSEPQTRFVADRIAYRSPDWTEVQLGEYEQDGLLDGIGAGPMPGPVYAAPAVATYGAGWAANTQSQVAPIQAWTYREAPPEAETLPAPVEEDPEIVRIHRYANYPVSQEEVEPEEVVEEAPPVYAVAYEVAE
jgi:hypothetical protein